MAGTAGVAVAEATHPQGGWTVLGQTGNHFFQEPLELPALPVREAGDGAGQGGAAPLQHSVGLFLAGGSEPHPATSGVITGGAGDP